MIGDSPNDPSYPGRELAPPGVNLARPTWLDWLQFRDPITGAVPIWVVLGLLGLLYVNLPSGRRR